MIGVPIPGPRMRPVRLHPVIASLLLALGSAALAFLAAALVGAAGFVPAVASIAAALVVTGAFAYRPVDGLLGFGITILFADTVEYWTGGNIRYVDEAAVVLFVLVAFTVHRGRMQIPRPGWREGALAVFFLAGVISSLIQAVPANVWILGLALLAKTFVFVYLVTSLSVTSDEVRRLSAAALIVGLAVSAVGIVEFLVPDFAIGFLGVIPYARSRGAVEIVNSWFTTPALYGWIAPFLSLFLFARFAVLRERWALVLAFVLGGAGLLSGRRTPLVSMVVSLAVGAVRAMRSRRISWRPLAAIGAGTVLVAALSVWSFGDFYATTFETYVGRPHRIMEVFAEKPRHWRVDVLHPLGIKDCFYDTAMTSGMIFMLFLGADILNSTLALSQFPAALAGVIENSGLPPLAVIAGILIFYVVLGCVMDEISMILLTLPIFLPTVAGLELFGLNPTDKIIWFGILVLMVVEIGLIMPPVGLNVYVINGLARDIPIRETYLGVMPFIASDFIRTGLLLAFPALSLWLVKILVP